MKKILYLIAFAFSILNLQSQGYELWGWGLNDVGQLGTGNTNNYNKPLKIGHETNWMSISTGRDFTIAIKSSGTLWAWGYNRYGQLGVGDLIDKNIPNQVGTDSNWKSISVGYYHCCAIKNDGTLWTWGYNKDGELGIGDTTNKTKPIQVGNESNWKTIFAGFWHTMALKNDNTLWAWGMNEAGELGIGDNIKKIFPTQVGIDTNWNILSSGNLYTCAIKNNGTLWAWGRNIYGVLGTGDTLDKNIPTQIGKESNWQSISSGFNHTIAIKNDGTLWAWGMNEFGELGDSTRTNTIRIYPFKIGVSHNWQHIYAGNGYTIALDNDGSLWAWGNNEHNQLGLYADSNYFPLKVNNDKNWHSVSPRRYNTMALKSPTTNVELDPNHTIKFTQFNNSEILINLIENSTITLNLYNMLGQLITKDVKFEGSQYNFKIDNLRTGAYILVLYQNNETSTYKFIKE